METKYYRKGEEGRISDCWRWCNTWRMCGLFLSREEEGFLVGETAWAKVERRRCLQCVQGDGDTQAGMESWHGSYKGTWRNIREGCQYWLLLTRGRGNRHREVGSLSQGAQRWIWNSKFGSGSLHTPSCCTLRSPSVSNSRGIMKTCQAEAWQPQTDSGERSSWQLWGAVITEWWNQRSGDECFQESLLLK